MIGLENQTVVEVSLLSYGLCFRIGTGEICCLGENDAGQLGTGNFAPVNNTLARVIGVHNADKLACGAVHCCVVSNSGHRLQCWGRGEEGQLGSGNLNPVNPIPNSIAIPRTIDMSCGMLFTCILTDVGDVQCTGDNRYGQMGINSTTTAFSTLTIVPGLANIVQLTLGAYHACALDSFNQPLCWGSNVYGELGIGSNQTVSGVIAPIGLPSPVAEIFAGSNSIATCFLLLTDVVYCTGNNLYGVLGSPLIDVLTTPVLFLNGTKGITDMVLNAMFGCVVQDGRLRCLGSNYMVESVQGMLGNGNTNLTLSYVLVDVVSL